jgi:hypothetical protein
MTIPISTSPTPINIITVQGQFSEKRPVAAPPSGDRPTGGAAYNSNTWSILGTAALLVLYSPFWLAGLTLTQLLHPHAGINPESILDFFLFTGISFGLFILIRSSYRRLQRKGSPAWILLFLLTLLLVSGLPGWCLFEWLPPSSTGSVYPPPILSSPPAAWPGSYSIITACCPAVNPDCKCLQIFLPTKRKDSYPVVNFYIVRYLS